MLYDFSSHSFSNTLNTIWKYLQFLLELSSLCNHRIMVCCSEYLEVMKIITDFFIFACYRWKIPIDRQNLLQATCCGSSFVRSLLISAGPEVRYYRGNLKFEIIK